MDDESRDLSLRLTKVLEKVGVSERMRQLRRDTLIGREIMITGSRNMRGDPHAVYIFGSSIEGTTTPDMNSDQDIVHCNETFPVIYHLDQAPSGRKSLLVLPDTRPGYIKLQLIHGGIPVTIHNSSFSTTSSDANLGHDDKGRVCYKHPFLKKLNTERNGPAETIHNTAGIRETDLVYALRSRTFHRAAVESLLECTRTGWLTRDDVEEMIQYGCLYVGVDHPSSIEKEYDWRVSFSLQERQLMFRLNPTQHNCYVLLKLIKGMLTSEPDTGKSITSYHCKTCLFRVINKTRSDQWTPDNLINCTFKCLTELLQCVRDGTCFNFFIKENNMFEGRVYGKVQERLIQYLGDMLNKGFALFYRIRSDNIGEALRGHANQFIDMGMRTNVEINANACQGIEELKLYIGLNMKRCPKEETAQHLDQQLRYLSSVNTITEHSQKETRAAVQNLELIVHSYYAAYLACRAFSTDIHVSKHQLLQDSDIHLKQAMTRDIMSGKLLYSSILYRQGNIDKCCTLLEEIEHSLHETVRTLCACWGFRCLYSDDERNQMLSSYPDPKSMMKSAVAVCTIFLPSHSEIIPTALQYELYRSVTTPLGSRRKKVDDWFDLAVVDSKVYLYFLQYLVYSRLNRPVAKRLAIDNLLNQLLRNRNLGHRETGYNLLGWIYSQEGQTEAAADCFIRSWMVRPHHNAAKWFMLILIYRQSVA